MFIVENFIYLSMNINVAYLKEELLPRDQTCPSFGEPDTSPSVALQGPVALGTPTDIPREP